MSTTLSRLIETWRLDVTEGPGEGRITEARDVNGAAVVVKLPAPGARHGDERAALGAWNGRGAPRLLAFDEPSGAIMLERISPGSAPPAPAAREVAALLGALAVGAPAGLPPLHDVVLQQLEARERLGEVSGQRIAWARAAVGRLHGEPGLLALVHGNLRSGHLLRCGEQGLRAIDPHPSAGDTAYDAACWIHAGGQPGRRARFDALAAALGTNRVRLRDWCGVVAVCAGSAAESL